MTTVKKQLNSANKHYLNSKDLQIPTISMTSKYLELKPVEHIKIRSVSHGHLLFRKSIIKDLHVLKKVWDMIRKMSGKTKPPSYTHLNRVVLTIKQPQKQTC